MPGFAPTLPVSHPGVGALQLLVPRLAATPVPLSAVFSASSSHFQPGPDFAGPGRVAWAGGAFLVPWPLGVDREWAGQEPWPGPLHGSERDVSVRSFRFSVCEMQKERPSHTESVLMGGHGALRVAGPHRCAQGTPAPSTEATQGKVESKFIWCKEVLKSTRVFSCDVLGVVWEPLVW